jgi:hypothetical protein
MPKLPDAFWEEFQEFVVQELAKEKAPAAIQHGFDPEMAKLIVDQMVDCLEGASIDDLAQYTNEIYEWQAILKARPGDEE